MSFYLDRLEAARREQRMTAGAAAASAGALPPRAWPCHRYQHQPPNQHAGAALLPRPQQHPPVPPLDAALGGGGGGVGQARGGGARGTWPGASVAIREAAPASAAPAGAGMVSAGGAGWLFGGCAREPSGSVAPAPAREEAGGVGAGEVREKRSAMEQARCSPPKRRAITPAKRRFPPGCGRDAPAAPLPVAGAGDDGSLSVHAPRDGNSGAPLESGPPPARPTTPAADRKDGVLFEVAASPTAAGAGGGSTALNKVSAPDSADCASPDGAHHCPGAALVKASEAPCKNSLTIADGSWNMNDTDSHGIAVPGSDDQMLKTDDNLAPSTRLLPRPTKVSACRRFPPGCGRSGSPLLAGSGSDKVWPPPSEAVARSDRDPMEVVAPLCSGTTDGAAKNKGLGEEEVASEVQESPIATLHDHATACRDGASAAGISAMEVCASYTSSSSEEMIGDTWQCEDDKSGGSSCNVSAESLAQYLPKEDLKGDRVSECASMDTVSSGAAAGLSDEGAMMSKKMMFTPRKSVKPHKWIQKPALDTQCSLFSMETEVETDQLSRHTADTIEDKNEVTTDQAMQDPMSADKCSWIEGKEAATGNHYFGPKKKVNVKGKEAATVRPYFGPKKKVNVKGQMDENEDSIMEDILSKIAVDQGDLELGHQNADARSRVKMLCSRFKSICRAIVQAVEQRSLKVRRIDIAADKLIRKLPGFTKPGPIIGYVPGVEIGDEFLYRVELALVGLHRPYQGGIDTTRDEHGMLIAISVVASGGYPDELSRPGELVYTGSGKAGCGDQKLENGNLALKNCIKRNVPVRVIHGFKGQNREGCSHSRAKEITTFTYDGLYRVVDCWREGRPGSKVLKYKLQRIPGQPGLPPRVAKFVRKSKI